jgi:DNA-3-methyladenine glycosylase II
VTATKEKMIKTRRLTIRAVPPFDFDLSARIFSDGDGQIQKYENGKFWRVIRIDSKLALVIVRASGTVDEPKLSVKLNSNEEILDNDKEKAVGIVCTLFNLKFDLEPFYEEVRRDNIMAGLTLRLRGLKSPTTPTVFEALIDSIVEQQISLKVAEGMERKLIKTFGDNFNLGGNAYSAFPTPEELAAASVERLRSCGLSSKKTEYVREISRLVADGRLDLEKFRHYENAGQIVSELDRVRGIGVWTAEMTMVRGMQKFEALPADDLGLRRVVSHYYCKDKKISGEETRGIAEKWGKWKGLAAFYLIMAEWLEC